MDRIMPGAWRPVAAKLTRPPLRAPTLHRWRLYERLQDAVRGRVTLVAGDAGFGKSTLLAGFLGTVERPARRSTSSGWR